MEKSVFLAEVMKALEFRNHPIHQKILELKARCNHPKTKEKIDPDSLLVIKTHVQLLSDRLSLALQPLVNVDELNAILAELQHALNHLTEFQNDENPSRVLSAQQHLANALPFVRNIPFLTNKAEFSFSELTANYAEFMDVKIAELNTAIQKLHDDLDQNQTQISQQNDLADSIKTQLTDQLNQTSEIASKFNGQLNDFAHQHEQKIQEISNNHKMAFEIMQEDLETHANETIEEILRLRDQAKEVLNIIGTDATSSDFKKTANLHHSMANNLRKISFVLMFIICIIILYFILGQRGVFNWQQYALRLISISIFIYPATYAAKESTKHRALAVENERAALELSALEPFIVLLDNTKKQEIKEKLVDKYFGREHQTAQKETQEDGVKTVPFELIDKLFKLFKS